MSNEVIARKQAILDKNKLTGFFYVRDAREDMWSITNQIDSNFVLLDDVNALHYTSGSF